MMTYVSRVLMMVVMGCLVLVLTCAGAAIPGSALQNHQAVDEADQSPRRVQRSFGSDYSNYFGGMQSGLGGNGNMINWKAALTKRGEPEKRQFEFYPASHFGSGLDRASFQDWSATFGRNYRSFGNGHGSSLGSSNLGGGYGLGRDGLQNWRAFFSRQSRGGAMDEAEN